MTEEWRFVLGSTSYQVSNLGRVRSRYRIKPLIPSPAKAGYLTFLMHGEGGNRRVSIARSVCGAFHGPPPTDRHQAAHCDGNKLNNYANNLRWATVRENHLDKRLHGTSGAGEQNGRAKLTAEQVEFIRASSLGSCHLARLLGVSRQHIFRIRRGENWRDVTALRDEAQAQFGEHQDKAA